MNEGTLLDKMTKLERINYQDYQSGAPQLWGNEPEIIQLTKIDQYNLSRII